MATKKTASKETPAKAPRVSTNDLLEKMRAQAGSVEGGSGGPSFDYFKFQDGQNVIRIVQHGDVPPLIWVKKHAGISPRRKFFSPMNLSWIIQDETILEEIMIRSKLSELDVERLQKYGDPYDVLFHALNQNGLAQNYTDAKIGQRKVLMVAYAHGKFGVLEQSLTMGQNLLSMVAAYPNIFSMEEGFPLSINKTGQKKATRYTAPLPLVNQVEPIVLNDGQDVPNLYDVIARGTLNYVDKIEFLCRSHPSLVRMAGLTVDDFGIDRSELKTTTLFDEPNMDPNDLPTPEELERSENNEEDDE